MWLSILTLAALGLGGGQGWGFRLAWEHNGRDVTHFEMCVDAEPCRVLDAVFEGGETWEAPLPVLTPGPHRIVVRSCNGASCSSGSPELSVRVKSYP
jgi:hypothetical protein